MVDASGDQTKMKSDNLAYLELIFKQIIRYRTTVTDGRESQSVHGQLNEFQKLIPTKLPTKTDLDEFKQQLTKHQPMPLNILKMF